MPPKKEPSEEQRAEKVRQEQRRGILYVDEKFKKEIGDDKLRELFAYIEFQIYETWKTSISSDLAYFGYCPLFEPLSSREVSPNYTMRVTFSDTEPIIEMFKRRDSYEL